MPQTEVHGAFRPWHDGRMSYKIRALTAEDGAEAWRLGSLSFGYIGEKMPEGWTPLPSGRTQLGAFDESGRLIAKTVDRVQGHWFGGRIVPASGVAGVAVAAEVRGQGLGRAVLTQQLADVRDRGAVISTLYPTTPFLYRRLGWEEVGALTYYAIPTASLTTVRPSKEVTLRPAVAADVPAIEDIYRAMARTTSGMMERTGPCFNATAEEFLADYHGVTVAIGPDGAIEGYASWDRGPGYDASGKVTVDDLIGLTPEATNTLIAMIGGWASVAPTVVWRLSAMDPALFQFSQVGARVESRQPWMLRIVDAPAAIAARGWPSLLNGHVDLELQDAECPWNAGAFRLSLSNGDGRLEPGGTSQVRVTARGLALLYSGAATPATIRRAGLLTGGDAHTDEFLTVATAGPAPSMHDYF